MATQSPPTESDNKDLLKNILSHGSIFGTELLFCNKKCGHTSEHGSDVSDYLIWSMGENFYQQNKEKFFNGITLGSTLLGVRKLVDLLVYLEFGLNFDQFYLIHKKMELFVKRCEHYDLFMVASFHAIYSHATIYFGLKDFFGDHELFIKNFLSNYGTSHAPHLSEYDNILFGIINEDGQYAVTPENVINDLANKLHSIFRQKYYEYVIDDMKVLTFIYVLNYYGFIKTKRHNYLLEAVKKAGCCHSIHNILLSNVSHQCGVSINLWFQNYSQIPKMKKVLLGIKEDIALYKQFIQCAEPSLVKKKSLKKICREKIQYGAKLLEIVNLPLDVIINGRIHYFTEVINHESSKLIFGKQKFIFVSKQMPKVKEEHRLKFQGTYCIITNGDHSLIYNAGVNKYYQYDGDYEIGMPANYRMWANTFTPNWNYQYGIHKQIILAPNISKVSDIDMTQAILAALQYLSFEPAIITTVIDHLNASFFE